MVQVGSLAEKASTCFLALVINRQEKRLLLALEGQRNLLLLPHEAFIPLEVNTNLLPQILVRLQFSTRTRIQNETTHSSRTRGR